MTPWSSVAPSTRLAAPQETSVGALPAVPTTSFIEWDGGNYIGRNAGLGAFTIGSSTSGAGYSRCRRWAGR
jgi:hypothetical protein